MASMIEICQRAAFKTGNGPLVSLDDGSDVSQAIQLVYESEVRDALTSGGWKFARRTDPLQQLSDVPAKPWNAVYEAPEGMLRLILVQDDRGLRLDHEECDLDEAKGINVLWGGWLAPTAVYAVYVKRVHESHWPDDFAMAIQLRMEGALLSGLAEQRTAASAREQMAQTKERRAGTRDANSSTATDPSEWDLTLARSRGAAWGAFRSRGRAG